VKYVRDRVANPELAAKVLGGNALNFYGPRLRSLVETL